MPQAGRVPALPVFLDSSFPPLPRSSVPEWTTTVRYSHFSNWNSSDYFETYADNALGTDQLDEPVGGCALAIALGISLEVSEIAYMASLVLGSTVGLAVRIDYPPSALSKLE